MEIEGEGNGGKDPEGSRENSEGENQCPLLRQGRRLPKGGIVSIVNPRVREICYGLIMCIAPKIMSEP